VEKSQTIKLLLMKVLFTFALTNLLQMTVIIVGAQRAVPFLNNFIMLYLKAMMKFYVVMVFWWDIKMNDISLKNAKI